MDRRDHGIVLRGNESGFSKIETDTRSHLNAVWAIDSSDVWIVGGSFVDEVATVLRWDGQAFSELSNSACNEELLRSGFGKAMTCGSVVDRSPSVISTALPGLERPSRR